MDRFALCFTLLTASEGGFTADPEDPGNWTGGHKGAGTLRGTKWGVSAAAFPSLDIAALTEAQAAAIYRALYWTRAGCDLLPGFVAYFTFDAAVTCGAGQAVRFLQRAVGAREDGTFGPLTLAAVRRQAATPEDADRVAEEMLAQRTLFMAGLATWPTFGLGWSRRLFRLPFQAFRLLPAQAAVLPVTSNAAAH